MDFKALLALQLAMTRQTWQAMTERGATEETLLNLDFFYVASGREEAARLSGFLQRETDYTVSANPESENELSLREWSVAGTTSPTTVSLDILLAWVRWMVLAGQENGPCEFDGWGAQLA